jgi:hypothetical protein
MHTTKDPIKTEFLTALINKKKVLIRFFSKEDGTVLVRVCAPMDYGPSQRSKDKSNRFHLWDFTSDVKSHVLNLKREQIVSLDTLPDSFEPSQFVTWTPNWIIPRNWGIYS